MAFYQSETPVTVSHLIKRISRRAQILGTPDRIIRGVSDLEHAKPGTLCFCSAGGKKAGALIDTCPGDIIIARNDLENLDFQATTRTIIIVENPMLFFIDCVEYLFPEKRIKNNQKGAYIHPLANLEQDTRIEPFAVIDPEVRLGQGCSVHSGVHLRNGTHVGHNVIIQSNSVIGAVGLAYGKEQEGTYVALPHLGRVVIEDNVHIGPNTTVIKGILTDTVIGQGTKIGNQVNIGHNVKIGQNCFISAGAILCGSAQMGDNCWVAPGAIVLNKVQIGSGAKIGLGAVVSKNVEPNTFVTGMPARPIPE